jgi:hypothetical protein
MELPMDVHGMGENGFAFERGPLLRQMAQAKVLGFYDGPAVRFRFSQDDIEKSGFSSPVVTDETDFFTRMNMKRDFLEKFLLSQKLTYFLYRNHKNESPFISLCRAGFYGVAACRIASGYPEMSIHYKCIFSSRQAVFHGNLKTPTKISVTGGIVNKNVSEWAEKC